MKRLLAGFALAAVALVADAQLAGGIMDSQKQGTAAITGGAINGTTIGATTPSTGAFTTLSASGAVALSPASANVVLSPTGTGVVTVNPATAGTINNVAIGGSTPLAGSFTTLGASSTSTLGVVNATGLMTVTGSLTLSGASRIITFGNGQTVGDDGAADLVLNTNGTTFNEFKTSGGTQMRVTHTASAVNYVQATGSATGNPVAISAQGSDATVHVRLQPKSTSPNQGALIVSNSGTGSTSIRTAQTTAPTCSTNCGTSPSVSGTDSAGIVTMGSSGSPASGWVVTFNGTWSAAPACIVQSALATMVVGKMPIAVVTTTTTLTVTTNGTAPATSDKYQYICIGVS